MKRLFDIMEIVVGAWCVLNGLFALTMGYLLAAGADNVYHGIELENLTGMSAFVFVLGSASLFLLAAARRAW